MKICLDPGHGGYDPGAVHDGVNEKDITQDVTYYLFDMLTSNNFDVLIVGENDHYSSLSDIVKESNDWGADFFLSIHCNSADNPLAEGIETFYYSQKKSAQLFLDELMVMFPEHKNRGAKKANFFVLKHTVAPAVLVELEFLSNEKMLQFFLKEENKINMALALTTAICKL